MTTWRARFASTALTLSASIAGACAGGAPLAPEDLRCPDCSLVLVSIDTLRADHLGCYGYSRPTSPTIDALARESILFEAAYAPSYHTADSHMSLFTGVYPSVHRVRNVAHARDSNALPPSIETFTEKLAAAGFATAGFHGGGNVSGPYGFARGFSTYRSTLDDLAPAVDWLGRRRALPRQRFFLFVHTFRTHDPYLPDPPYNRIWLPDGSGDVISDPKEFESLLPAAEFGARRKLFWSRVDPENPSDRETIVALYDGAIRQVDDEIGPLLTSVAALPQRTLVVLVSDHGEEFYEHGGNLHDQVYEETLRVPFLIRLPDRRGAGTRIPWRASLVDLAPTILDLLGVDRLSRAQGRSLVPHLPAGSADPKRVILAEKVVGASTGVLGTHALKQALLAGDEKLILWPTAPRQLFDLLRDPGEKLDLAKERGASMKRLSEALDRRNLLNSELWRALPRSESGVRLDAETVERLGALGYL